MSDTAKDYCGLCGGASKGEHASDCPTPFARALFTEERKDALCARLLEAAQLACQLEMDRSVFGRLALKAHQIALRERLEKETGR